MDACTNLFLKYKENYEKLLNAIKEGDEFSAKLYAILLSDIKKLLIKYCNVNPSVFSGEESAVF